MTELTPEQIRFVQEKVGTWLSCIPLETRPTSADAWHSALLQRLLSGQKIFKHAPPVAYSYPWYDLVEKGRAKIGEAYVIGGQAWIEQAPWVVKEKVSERVFEVYWSRNDAYSGVLTLSEDEYGRGSELILDTKEE